jgi:ketosteroid isomerase-like protein
VSEGAPSVVAVTDTVDLIRRYVDRLEARDWPGVADALHPDVVYLLPQTREVVRGRAAYLRWNREYPDVWHLRLVSAYGDETGGAARLSVAIDGEDDDVDALVFVAVADGRLVEITDWWPTPYEPDPSRAHLADRQ